MTIQQLKYVIVVANSESLREAAGRLFISQPALSATIRDLEQELNIQLFKRTNKGIYLTEEGSEFLVYAKAAVSQYGLIEARFGASPNGRKHFSVSMQHYIFAVHAFARTVKAFDSGEYTYSVHETRTDEVLLNVKNLKSEIGIISFSQKNEKVMRKLLNEYHLIFTPLMVKDTYAYIWKSHPLSGKKELTLEELKEYPCISFDQSSDNEFYLTEEALGDYAYSKKITSTDRATSAELMVALNGYSVGIGNMVDSLALKDDIIAVKLKEEDPLMIGYITRENHALTDIGKAYIQELQEYKEL